MNETRNHSPAQIVYEWALITKLLGDTDIKETWPGFINFKPDKPDRVITISNTGGQLDGRGMKTRKTYEHPSIQFYVRGTRTGEAQAYDKCVAIKDAIDAVKNKMLTLDDDQHYILQHLSRTTSITALGRSPETDRPAFTINALVNFKPHCE